MFGDVAETAPGNDKASVALGCNAGGESGEKLAVGAKERGFEDETLERRRVSERSVVGSVVTEV